MIARVVAAVLLALTACAPREEEVVVLAAASLTEAFSEIESEFERAHPATDVTLSFAGSALLAAQIVQGAPADVFASADAAQMQAVVEAGEARDPVVFASNRIVVIVSRSAGVEIDAPQDLAEEGIRVVLGSPEVPVGAYARAFFDELGIGQDVEANVVSNETDTKEVLAKVVFGEADAGVVYATDVTEGVEEDVEVVALPGARRALYPVARLSSGGDEASELIAFLLSERGGAILEEHGFGAP